MFECIQVIRYWLWRHRRKRHPLILYNSPAIKGVTMDIVLHIGGREFFQLTGKDADGDQESLTNDTIGWNTSDPQISDVMVNPNNPTMIAIDGHAVGQCTITLNATNADGTVTAPTVLNITVLEKDVVEVDVAQIGGEGKIGDPFPTS